MDCLYLASVALFSSFHSAFSSFFNATCCCCPYSTHSSPVLSLSSFLATSSSLWIGNVATDAVVAVTRDWCPLCSTDAHQPDLQSAENPKCQIENKTQPLELILFCISLT
ncbi:Hypothetical predicted protein [Podarcis lilfordi]|uniref:Secreted protein n=1 Tax=Podarcis lilfordi TaxID=74358 RepID=A0AA35JQ38_9SAUR|nr:Hypothetical predicted protein [Podarcis lilfordi]